MNTQAKILVVDDEKGVRNLLGNMLQRKGYEVQCVSSAQQALKALGSGIFHLVITDLKMPGMTGEELVARLKREQPSLPVVVISAFGGTRSVVEVIKNGAEDYLSKPFMQEDLEVVVFKALAKHRLLIENQRLRRELGDAEGDSGLIGSAPAMRKAAQLLDKVAKGKGNILITGESGTGKELAARAIHLKSGRSQEPFIEVNAGAIPAALFEAELFGAKKGAFTGSGEDREGLFQAAQGGFLFLDEVAEVPLELQAKLLRVLESGEVRRVGDARSRKVDVRVISATNQDLEAMVSAGRFRKDLYFRLAVLPVHLPSLREHAEDIPQLVQHFLGIAAPGQVRRLSQAAMRLLLSYSWPGNVRELKNAIERATLFSSEPEIGSEDLILTSATQAQFIPQGPLGKAKQMAALDFERRYLLQNLKDSSGNVSRAAKAAGMDRRNFQSLLKRHRIDPSTFRNLKGA